MLRSNRANRIYLKTFNSFLLFPRALLLIPIIKFEKKKKIGMKKTLRSNYTWLEVPMSSFNASFSLQSKEWTMQVRVIPHVFISFFVVRYLNVIIYCIIISYVEIEVYFCLSRYTPHFNQYQRKGIVPNLFFFLRAGIALIFLTHNFIVRAQQVFTVSLCFVSYTDVLKTFKNNQNRR